MEQYVDTLPEYGDPVPPPATANTYKPKPGTYGSESGPSFDFRIIDDHARKMTHGNSSTCHTFDIRNLHTVIERQVDKDLWTVRGILVCLGQQAKVDSEEIPLTFTTLCRTAGIQCVTIYGLVKGIFYKPGDMDLTITTWNAVKINGNWHLVFPRWVLSAVVGYKSGGYKKLESDGQSTVEYIEKKSGSMIRNFADTFFLVRPEFVINLACPFDTRWQLLPSSDVVSIEEFKRRVRMRPEHFEFGIKLVSSDSCVLKADNGLCTVIFRVRNNTVSNVKTSYELFLEESSVSTKLLKTASQNRFVYYESQFGALFRYEIRFPIEGKFKLSVTFKCDSQECPPIEFRLDCSERRRNCRPLPVDVGDVGWGPGPKAIEVGLHHPSQQIGRIRVHSKHIAAPGENQTAALDTDGIKLSFQVDRKTIGQYDYDAQLSNDVPTHRGEQRLADLKTLVRTELDECRGQLDVVAKVPDTQEYALTIMAGKTSNMEEPRVPVCHYLLTEDFSREQKEMQEKAIETLQEVLTSGDENLTDSCMAVCDNAEVDKADSVPTEARSKLGDFNKEAGGKKLADKMDNEAGFASTSTTTNKKAESGMDEKYRELKQAMKHWVTSDLKDSLSEYKKYCTDEHEDKVLQLAEKIMKRRKAFDEQILLAVKPFKETLESLKKSLRVEGRRRDSLVSRLKDKARKSTDPDFAMGVSILLQDV